MRIDIQIDSVLDKAGLTQTDRERDQCQCTMSHVTVIESVSPTALWQTCYNQPHVVVNSLPIDLGGSDICVIPNTVGLDLLVEKSWCRTRRRV